MNSDDLEKEFHISRLIIVYKFILGLIELLLGLGIFFWGNLMVELYQNFRDQELLEDPHDLLVFVTEKILPYIIEHKGYIILILILLGLVKVIGSIGLMYKKLWGLDLLIGLTILLLPFEFFSMVSNPTVFKYSYFFINLLIALYLVQFKPHKYFLKIKKRIRK